MCGPYLTALNRFKSHVVIPWYIFYTAVLFITRMHSSVSSCCIVVNRTHLRFRVMRLVAVYIIIEDNQRVIMAVEILVGRSIVSGLWYVFCVGVPSSPLSLAHFHTATLFLLYWLKRDISDSDSSREHFSLLVLPCFSSGALIWCHFLFISVVVVFRCIFSKL